LYVTFTLLPGDPFNKSPASSLIDETATLFILIISSPAFNPALSAG